MRDSPVKPIQRRMQIAVPLRGILFSLIRDYRQIGNAEPFVVVTVTWALEAFVPSSVTDHGATVQEAPVGKPEQRNTTA